ncbi:uncharacterized protein UBRO_20993 [Ustilago bromivora]|uniref:Uncharacterized protein n=1 Tax=Ustilago bromivora TaxID=307758 RepID=A0A1K0G3C1_9BASI|nr:uncharacterized protein UBRO_20993 [Ustilago bromivora]
MVSYLNQTSVYQLGLGGSSGKHSDQPVVTYTNANWVSDPTNGQRSTSGAIMGASRHPNETTKGTQHIPPSSVDRIADAVKRGS